MSNNTEKFSFEHCVANVNNINLHYVIAGSGDPIVLLHGWPQTWYAWKDIIPELAKSHTIIVPDLRGAGLSDKPKTGYDKLTLAQDIHALSEKLGFNQISLVGHDLGGMVAFTYAAEYPENVKKLVILDVLIPGLGLEQIMDVANGGMWHFGFHMVPDLPEALITGRERLYLDYFFKHVTYNPASIKEKDLAEYVRAYSAPGALRAGFESYRTLFEDREHNKKYLEKKLNMPILAYGGEISVGDNLRQSLLSVANNVEGGSIPECGHFIPEEKPEFLIKVLNSFFSEA
jgi:pimeloyl-ACP methyl ester carboxylesterase